MVLRVADGGQTPALERVGEHDVGAGVEINLGEGVAEFGEVVSAQVAEGFLEVVVFPASHQPRHVPGVARDPGQPLAQTLGRHSEQALIDLVGHFVYGETEQFAVGFGELGLELLAVLGVNHVPAVGVEHFAPGADSDAWNDSVEALPVEVNDPEDVAKPLHLRFGYGFPDRAFVQFRVADYGYVAVVNPGVGEQVRLVVLVHERGEVGRDRAESDGAGGEVHVVRVLGAAGVGLEAVVLAQHGQVGGIEVVEQVLDGVIDGRGVGLDRYSVAGAHEVEVEGGHYGGDGRAGSLVSADLRAVRALAHVVGVMNHVHRKPQNAVLYPLQNLVAVNEAFPCRRWTLWRPWQCSPMSCIFAVIYAPGASPAPLRSSRSGRIRRPIQPSYPEASMRSNRNG